MRLPAELLRARVEFDDPNIVSFSGLVPVLALAERAGLSELIEDKVWIDPAATKVASAGVNPAGKLTSIIAGMACGADCIDDLDAVRSGGMKLQFGGVYAATTVGQFLREFTHGHTMQLGSVLRAHLVNLRQHSDLLPGLEQRALIDIDSLLRPVYGHQKQGASYGHTKIAGAQVLRKGLSPLVTTISTPADAPVIAGVRLRAGNAGSGKGAASMVAQAIRTARAAGATGQILVRGDSAYGSAAVVNAFPVWRHHPFTNNTADTAQADIVHRHHAIIETVFSDVIDGPFAHMPSGQFASNAAWAICAAIMHNLLRAAGSLIGGPHKAARGTTLRRHLIAVPARLARPQRRPVIHHPPTQALALGRSMDNTLGRGQRPTQPQPDHHPPPRPDRNTRGKAGHDQQITHAHLPEPKTEDQLPTSRSHLRSIHGSRLNRSQASFQPPSCASRNAD